MCEELYFENLWCEKCQRPMGFERRWLRDFRFDCECGHEITSVEEYEDAKKKNIEYWKEKRPRDLCELEIW